MNVFNRDEYIKSSHISWRLGFDVTTLPHMYVIPSPADPLLKAANIANIAILSSMVDYHIKRGEL